MGQKNHDDSGVHSRDSSRCRDGSLDEWHCTFHALRNTTAHHHGGYVFSRGRIHKPLVHFMANVFAIPDTVLDEGDFITSDDIQVSPVTISDVSHGVGNVPEIASLPLQGGPSIGVTDNDAITAGCHGVFVLLLQVTDAMKIIVGPGVVGCEDGFGVVSTHFRNPFHAQFFGNCTSEGGGSGGFGANNYDACGKPGAHGIGEVLPVSKEVGPNFGAGYGVAVSIVVHGNVGSTHVVGPRIPVGFAGKDGIGNVVEKFGCVGGPGNGIVIFPNVRDDTQIGIGVDSGKPIPAMFCWDFLARVVDHQDINVVAVS